MVAFSTSSLAINRSPQFVIEPTSSAAGDNHLQALNFIKKEDPLWILLKTH